LVLEKDQNGERGLEDPGLGTGAAIVSDRGRKKIINKTKNGGMDHFWFLSWLESQSRPS